MSYFHLSLTTWPGCNKSSVAIFVVWFCMGKRKRERKPKNESVNTVCARDNQLITLSMDGSRDLAEKEDLFTWFWLLLISTPLSVDVERTRIRIFWCNCGYWPSRWMIICWSESSLWYRWWCLNIGLLPANLVGFRKETLQLLIDWLIEQLSYWWNESTHVDLPEESLIFVTTIFEAHLLDFSHLLRSCTREKKEKSGEKWITNALKYRTFKWEMKV